MSNQDQDWQDLARLASEEKDPERLMELVKKLNIALQKKHEPFRSSIPDMLNPDVTGPKDGRAFRAA
jgi:hypothetical protein